MNILQGFHTTENWDSQSKKTVGEALRNITAGTSISETNGTASGGPALQQGQVFSGEILNITAKDVTILLNNQQTINARLGEALELNIGQRLLFEVKENQGEQIFIRPLENGTADGQNVAAEKALTANGFALTKRNYTIARQLMEAGMPLDKESMRKVMQQSMRLPEADIRQLIDMNRLGIPVNAVNVRQFAQYTVHQHQLTQAMQQVLDGLEQTLETGSETKDLEQLQTLNRQLMDIFGWKSDGMGTETVLPETMAGETNAAAPETLSVPEETEAEVRQQAGLQEQAGSGQPETITDSNSPATERLFLNGLREQLTEMGIPEEAAKELTDGGKEYGSIISQISDLIEQTGLISEQAAKNFFQSDHYRKLLKKGIQEQWLMKPDAMKEPKDIDRLYEKIYRQAAQMEESLASDGQSGRQFSEQSKNMRENLQFMQQLNQQFIFAQLPMKMSGQEANSELFVYANKKRLQQADGVRVLLHLDMPNLGSTDILVRLKDKMLHASFTLADQTSVTVLAENMEDLTQKLEEKGFHFTNEVKVAEEQPKTKAQILPDPVVEEMLDQDLVTGVKRYTFDMRT